MSDLISREALLKEVRENKELYESERVYLEGLLLNAPSIPDPNIMAYISLEDLENAFICGYRVKDLIVLGKLFRDKGITENELVNASESFLAGYRKAYEEINEAINKTVNSIGSKDTDPITELFGVNGEEFIVSGGVIMPKKED